MFNFLLCTVTLSHVLNMLNGFVKVSCLSYSITNYINYLNYMKCFLSLSFKMSKFDKNILIASMITGLYWTTHFQSAQ